MKPLPPVLIGLVAGFLAFQVIVLVNWPLVLTIALAVFLGLTLFTAAIIGEYEFRKYLDSCREAKTPINANAGQIDGINHLPRCQCLDIHEGDFLMRCPDCKGSCSVAAHNLRCQISSLQAKLSRSHLRRGKRGRFISRSPKNHVQ